MADITCCQGTNCPLKEKCYRFTAPRGRYQSYFTEVPYDLEKQECEHYWPREAA